MQTAARKQAQEFAHIVEAITDERVRYFYLMLGEALAESGAAGQSVRANTSPAHVAEIAARLTGH